MMKYSASIRTSALNGEHYHIIEFFRDKIALRKIPPLVEHPYNKD